MQICTTCSKLFQILPQEKEFYKEKVHLPLPKDCPQCRNIRRMTYRNDRTFYKRKCDKSGKEIISMYAPDSKYKVYHQSEWWKQESGSWDPMDYSQDFDFNKPFFEQFHELQLKVPRLGMDLVNCENSDYCNYCGDERNCYLDIAGEGNEDCYFNLFTKFSKDTADCTFAYNSTLCYQSLHLYNCYNTRFSIYCETTTDSFFCYDLKGCQNCIFSSNLRQKQYHIFNKPYQKEEYFQYLKSLQLNTISGLEKAIAHWKKVLKESGIIYRDQEKTQCEESTGNNLKNCKNIYNSFNATNCEDSAYLYDVLDAKDCYDLNYSLYKPEFSCELISTLAMKSSAYCMASHYCNNIFYCDLTNNSSDLFGCIGINRKKFCILNKQYTEEEYKKLVPKIIEHMEKTAEWGQFFPEKFSPHGYNETVAHEYFPITQEQALAKNFTWREESTRENKPQTFQVPENIENITEEITSQILSCKNCTKNFRIILQELRFYKKMELPIPQLCPLCRHLQRNELRTPRALVADTCSQCKKVIETTFPSGHEEKIYCEECYLKAIQG